MPVVLQNLRLVFHEVPKVASTAVKLGLFEAEFGRPFDRFEHGGRHVHRVMTDLPFSTLGVERFRGDLFPDFHKAALVRDPVKRLLSAYANRVLHSEAVRKSVGDGPRARFGLWRRGLRHRPSLDEFLEKFDAYRSVSRAVKIHTDHCRRFLGKDLAALDAIYPIERIGEFADDLSERAGRRIEFPRAQEGGPKIAWESVGPASQRRLLEITRDEYAFLADFYRPPEITAEAPG